MGSRAQKYLERALNCQCLADAMRDPILRFDLLEIARQWQELAEQVEWLDQLSLDERLQ